MMQITVTVSIGLVAKREISFEVEDSATEDEIDRMAQDVAMEALDWSWKAKELP